MISADDDYFDSLYETSDDPWGFRSRWYERRKRLLTLAMLPRERYRNGFEPGCANGELTTLLAARCDNLLAADLNATAVRLAAGRVATQPHVRVEQRGVPHDWPDASFDLIVISELAYYLNTADIEQLCGHIRGTLTPDGTLLACHWRRPFDAAPQPAASVHTMFDTHCGLARLVRYEDPDMLLDVWSHDARSVAEREGFA